MVTAVTSIVFLDSLKTGPETFYKLFSLAENVQEAGVGDISEWFAGLTSELSEQRFLSLLMFATDAFRTQIHFRQYRLFSSLESPSPPAHMSSYFCQYNPKVTKNAHGLKKSSGVIAGLVLTIS